jgi:RNA polymerase sigma factor (sigma-70 family)
MENETMTVTTDAPAVLRGEEMHWLLSRCAGGDAAAWDRLLGETRRLTLDLARWKYRLSPEDAEDVAQVVQIRVSERLVQLRRSASFPLWVRRLAHHAVVDHLRQRRPQLSLDALCAAGGEAALGPAGADEFENVVLRADLARALERLPDHYREPIRLHVLEGIPQDEVGRLLGRPRSTVASQVERGLKRLARALPPAAEAGC